MSIHVRIAGISFTAAAAANIEETGLTESEILGDRRDISADRETEASLLRRCMAGADEDRVEGWRDYVAAVVAAAEAENQSHTR